MKKIVIAYWHLSKFKELPYEHNQEFEYSEETRNELINVILAWNFSIMLRPNMGEDKDTLIIYIDKGRFGQS